MHRRQFLASASACAASALLPRLALAQTAQGAFELTAGIGEKPLYKETGKPSSLWLYNNSLPGPEIRVRKGETVKVRFTNNLPEPTSVHWHGIRIVNEMDGVSGLTQAAVEPGESFDYEFTVPDAGTFWYHAHNRSWNQVPRGLSGALIVEGDEDTLPRERDITLMMTDWMLTEDGVLTMDGLGSPMEFAHAGRHGNWLTVNGIDRPDIPVIPGQWHRVRLVNTSTARVLQIDPSRFGGILVALDGQAVSEPHESVGVMLLAPAQRADFMMMAKPGRTAFEMMDGEPFEFAAFVGREDVITDRMARPMPVLSPNALAEPDLDTARQLKLTLQGGAMGRMNALVHDGEEKDPRALMQVGQFWGMNGIAGMSTNALFVADKGETLVIDITNETAWPHGIHTHGHHFRVLELNGKVDAHRDWRDTVLIDRGETAKIAMVADNPGSWLLHCHMLGHAASGMSNWFSVG